MHGDCGTDKDGNPIMPSWDPNSVPQWDPTQGVGATPTEAAAPVDPLQDVNSAEFRCMVHGECGEPSGDGKRGKQKLQRRKGGKGGEGGEGGDEGGSW